MIRNGKIARLPRSLRDELNRRLSANEDGASLLNWLNASPDAQAVLARDFAGEPITKQNLYEWRNGGFLASRTRQELLAQAGDLAADASELDAAACGQLIGNLVALLAVRYAAVLARWNDGDVEALRVQLRVLHTFTRDLAALHRINQFAERQPAKPKPSDRKAPKTAIPAATIQQRNPSRARADGDITANRPHNPESVQTPDFAPVAAPRQNAVNRHSGSATAPCAADQSFPRNTGAPVLDQDLATCCATDAPPVAPQSGFGRLPSRGSAANPAQPPSPNWPVPAPHRAAFSPVKPVKPMPAPVSVLAPQPRTPSRQFSTMDAPLDKVVPVLIAPGDAVNQFVAANTRPPETGLLPATLRREIFEAIVAQK